MQPLDGVRVLDLGIWRPAPFATQLLAELGAEVTRIEPPGGDPMRVFPDLHRTLNRRKRVLERNLKDELDLVEVLRLAADSDVVVEGFRPGVAVRLGVGFEEIAKVQPRILYCSISGFGQDGPLAPLAGHDLNYQAWSGVLAARFPEVHRNGVPIGDLAGGVHAALAICAALVGRGHHEDAVHIDVSIADVLLTWAGPRPGGDLIAGEDVGPGSRFPAYGTFECADGQVTLGVVTEDHFWSAICQHLGLDDVSGLDAAARAAEGPALRSRLEAVTRTRRRDELVAELIAAGVPVAPILDASDAVTLDHFLARGVSAIDADGAARLAHPVQFRRRPPVD